MSKKLYPDQNINDILESEESSFFKNDDDIILEKGGEGSGKKGHVTPARARLNAKLTARGVPADKHHLYSDRHTRRETSIGVDALGNDLRPGEESKRAYAGQPMTRDHQAQEKRRAELKDKK